MAWLPIGNSEGADWTPTGQLLQLLQSATHFDLVGNAAQLDSCWATHSRPTAGRRQRVPNPEGGHRPRGRRAPGRGHRLLACPGAAGGLRSEPTALFRCGAGWGQAPVHRRWAIECHRRREPTDPGLNATVCTVSFLDGTGSLPEATGLATAMAFGTKKTCLRGPGGWARGGRRAAPAAAGLWDGLLGGLAPNPGGKAGVGHPTQQVDPPSHRVSWIPVQPWVAESASHPSPAGVLEAGVGAYA